MNAFFLVGPTAVGKTDVAQRLAERMSTGILSADSMQVYRGMDIGTAKIPTEARGTVPYAGMDLVNPDQSFSVWLYREQALAALRSDALNGRRTIIVGGTGLYVKSLVDGLEPASAPSLEARVRWENLWMSHGIGALKEALRSLDGPALEALSDKENPRRLIRALERAQSGISASPAGWRERRPEVGGAPLVGLTLPTADLRERIGQRVRAMYGAGLIDEVRGLLQRYGTLSETAGAAIGYAEAIACIRGECGVSEAVERTLARTRSLAKRQRTWFRHQADVRWVEVDMGMSTDEVADRVWSLWSEYGPTTIRE
jgi:tRNA dimethylallyltransferase